MKMLIIIFTLLCGNLHSVSLGIYGAGGNYFDIREYANERLSLTPSFEGGLSLPLSKSLGVDLGYQVVMPRHYWNQILYVAPFVVARYDESFTLFQLRVGKNFSSGNDQYVYYKNGDDVTLEFAARHGFFMTRNSTLSLELSYMMLPVDITYFGKNDTYVKDISLFSIKVRIDTYLINNLPKSTKHKAEDEMQSLLNTRQWQKAILTANYRLRLDNKNAFYWQKLGEAQEALGMNEEACASYHSALLSDPTGDRFDFVMGKCEQLLAKR